MLVSLLTALEEPAPAGPPVAPPAAAAEASPEPEPCALSRVSLGPVASPLTAVEEPAPAGPPVAPPAAAASLELPACANASVDPSVRTDAKAIVVSFMGCPFIMIEQPTRLFERSEQTQISLGVTAVVRPGACRLESSSVGPSIRNDVGLNESIPWLPVCVTKQAPAGSGRLWRILLGPSCSPWRALPASLAVCGAAGKRN